MGSPGITKVGVLGCGLMGSGIAEVVARAGLPVIVWDIDSAALERGRQRVKDSVDRASRRGKLSQLDVEVVRSNLSFRDDLTMLADCDLIIEAVIESGSVKGELFRRIDQIVRWPDAILATNTSSIPVMKLGMMTSRPSQVLGIHFFNPVPILRLVEVVPSLLTSDDVLERATSFVTDQLNKTVVVAKDRAGFIVNSLLIPYVLSAVRMLESGYASAEDIDVSMMEGCAHPMGPLHLADLVGLDTAKAIAESLYEEFKEPLFAPPPLLCRMVDAGLLGRKTGRGFFRYEP